MKPLRKGAARTGLVKNIDAVIDSMQLSESPYYSTAVAAILGGAIEQTCKDQGIPSDLFFKYMNFHTFDLIRTLKASNLLDTIK